MLLIMPKQAHRLAYFPPSSDPITFEIQTTLICVVGAMLSQQTHLRLNRRVWELRFVVQLFGIPVKIMSFEVPFNVTPRKLFSYRTADLVWSVIIVALMEIGRRLCSSTSSFIIERFES